MTTTCEICKFENSIGTFDSYQSGNKIHYECLDKTMCKQRLAEQQYKNFYGGLEKYGINFNDLEQLPHTCRCMQHSYFCKKNGKYYVQNYAARWIETDSPKIPKEYPNVKLYNSYTECGLNIDDLDPIKNSDFHHCKRNNKYYNKIKSVVWREIDASDIHKENHFP